MNWNDSEPIEFCRIATVATALCRVASIGRALRWCPLGTRHIGETIEGTATAALLEILTWTKQFPCGPARALEARIWARLRHGDRTDVGLAHARSVVAAAWRGMERDG